MEIGRQGAQDAPRRPPPDQDDRRPAGPPELGPARAASAAASPRSSAQEIEELGREAIEFAKFSLQLFDDIVLGNTDYVDLITERRLHPPDLQHGHGRREQPRQLLRRQDPRRRARRQGARASTTPQDYRDYIAEHVEPWSYLKFPYLKKVGWKGFVDGAESGVYKATPLSRLNAADGMATPLAQAEYERVLRDARAASRCTTRWPPTGPG